MWLTDLFAFLRPNTEAFKAITGELRALKEEYQREAAESKKRIKELEKELALPGGISDRVKQLEADERNCQQHMIEMGLQIQSLQKQINSKL